jgi:hypothetical protein
VDDAVAMSHGKRVSEQLAVPEYLFERQRTPSDAIGERFAVYQLHHEIVGALIAADVVKGANAGVIQRRDRPRFAFEADSALGIGRGVRRQDFDGDRAIEAGIACAIYLAHAAGAEQRVDLERSESRAPGELQAC